MHLGFASPYPDIYLLKTYCATVRWVLTVCSVIINREVVTSLCGFTVNTSFKDRIWKGKDKGNSSPSDIIINPLEALVFRVRQRTLIL